jgi:hypothetical protein
MFCFEDDCNHILHHHEGFQRLSDLMKHVDCVDHFHSVNGVRFNHDAKCEIRLKWECSECDYKSSEQIAILKHYSERHVQYECRNAANKVIAKEIAALEAEVYDLKKKKRKRDDDYSLNQMKLDKLRSEWDELYQLDIGTQDMCQVLED